jgi:hypothetical protein
MADVIEHIEKAAALQVLESFLARGSTVIVSTPRQFFQQDLYESPEEHHVSFWTLHDFQGSDRTVLHQNVGPGVIYVVKRGRAEPIRGFGNDLLTKARRMARLARAELGL